MKNRKGSLLFEILLGMAAMLLIISVSIPTIRNQQFQSDFKNFLKQSNNIIKENILDTFKGYPSVNNTYCAPDYINSYSNITAYRVVKCTGLSSTIDYYYDNSNIINETDSTKSFFYALNEWIYKDSTSNYGCKYYIGEGNTTSNFNVFYDCSQIRKPEIADSEILVYFKKHYPTKLIGYDINGLSIDSTYVPIPSDNPSDIDGKILLKFQK